MINDIATFQRALNLAGFNAGAVDGIAGKKTKAAAEKWQNAVEKIRADYPVDARSDNNLSDLIPAAQLAARKWLIEKAYPVAAAMGIQVKIICGVRDFAEQNRLYSKGRTAPGPKVTNARAGSSWHNYAVAFDIGLFSLNGQTYLTNDKLYIDLVTNAGIPTGFAWGGRFKSFKDYPHFQYEAVAGSLAELKRKSS